MIVLQELTVTIIVYTWHCLKEQQLASLARHMLFANTFALFGILPMSCDTIITSCNFLEHPDTKSIHRRAILGLGLYGYNMCTAAHCSKILTMGIVKNSEFTDII